MHHSSTDVPASSNAIDDALERLDRAAQLMVDQAEAQLAARRMRDAGVPIGRPDDLLAETLAAVSPGAEPTASEREESTRYFRGYDASSAKHTRDMDEAYDRWSDR